jgi:hypothetical protein
MDDGTIMPCWHSLRKVYHAFQNDGIEGYTSLCGKGFFSAEKILPSTCLPIVDPFTQRVCDICFRKFCLEVIGI